MLKAILFDMDGTITRPNIDWKDLRARVGVPEGVPIMAHIDSLPRAEAETAEGVVREVEYEAARTAEASPGVCELFEYLDQQPLDLVLVTNNHRRAMHHIVDKLGLNFRFMLSREDATLKPAPDLMILALGKLGLDPSEVVCVGDGHYDASASAAAGIRYIHLSPDRSAPVEGPTIGSLGELLQYLEPGVGDDLPQPRHLPSS